MKTLAQLIDEWLDEGRTVVLTKRDGKIWPQVTIAEASFVSSLSDEKKKIGFDTERCQR